MKRLFTTFLGVSAYLVFYLVTGMAPLQEATEAASVGKQRSWLVAEGISPSVVSCLGDSITNGYPYEGTENTYPARLLVMLETAYGSGGYNVINHGVNGYRADQVLYDLEHLNWMAEDNPDFVLLMVGGNDLAQEVLPDLSNLNAVISQTVAEVQDIVNVVNSHTNADGSHPQIIVSAFPPNRIAGAGGSAVVALYNSSLESNLTGADLWSTDNWDDFYDPGTGQAWESLMSSDEVHPNAEGYAVMAENWFGAIDSLLHHFYLPLILRNY
jgi:lysophospholipase L1-like esterase